MKYLIYTDVHWSSYSSIVRSRGSKYSTRLENLIKSVNWAEQLAIDLGCETVICMGDFFDTAQLNAEEVTALEEIKWANLKHYFLVGNHEMARNDLEISTSHLFNMRDFNVVDKPLELDNILFLPYMLHSTDYKLPEYKNYRIVFSHNDLKGIQMGKFISTSGLDIEDIESKCDLFINGHLHNGEQVSKKVINLGNLSGQNFSEDAFKYSHNAMFLDTEKREIQYFTNPYAFKFYKIDETKDFIKFNFDEYSVVSCTSSQDNLAACKDMLNNCCESRILIDYGTGSQREIKKFEKVDNLKQFIDYVLSNIGTDNVVQEELQEVCK